MTRILVWPADQAGCGHYRLIWPAETLAAQGVDVTVDIVGPTLVWDRRWSGTVPPLDANVLGLAARPDADVVIIQRPGRRIWCQVIDHLQAAGIRVVVDVDDDFAHIPAGNVACREYDPKRSPHMNWAWIDEAARKADLVTVTTPALAGRYARHGRVAVLPNRVPASYLTLTADDRYADAAGWTGSVDTHPDDLETCGGTVGRVLRRAGWQWRTVGTGQGVPQRLALHPDTPVSASGWRLVDDYALEYARLTVALVPLSRSQFNRGKSALKLAEAAALGVPVVASPTPDNVRLHADGVGLLAKNPAAWERHLTRLLASAELRAELADRGREAMAAHTYQACADSWAAAWLGVVGARKVAA